MSLTTKDGVGTDSNDKTECYHTNFTTSELLHKKEKTDYITYQFICKDCDKHLDMTWKLWCVEDLEQNKIVFKADGNQALKSVLDDEKFTDELVETCAFDGGDNEWIMRAKAEEMLDSIREKIAKERNEK